MFEEDLDLGDIPDENKLLEGSMPEAGWYRCVVEDVSVEKDATDTLSITLRVERSLSGRYIGAAIKERLWGVQDSADAEKAQTAKKRRAIWAKRLGLIDAAAFGTQARVVWADAVGRECVVEVKEREYIGKDTIKKKACNITFAGIFPPDHKDVPVQLRDVPPPTDGRHTPTPPAPATQPPPQKAEARMGYTRATGPAARVTAPDYSDL